MKVKTVALLVVAIGCGLVAMIGVQQAMKGKQGGPQEEKVSVLMAVTEIPVGTSLTPENVMFKDVDISLVPENAITTEEQYAERAAKRLILPNTLITMNVLGEPGVTGGSMAIPKGMRVVSVKVNDTQTHSGMLAPGDRVDVLVTYQSRGRGGTTTQVRPLLEYVPVFATGSQTENSSDAKKGAAVKNVSLLVTPEQASFVYLAERKGELSLVWRNKADDEQVQVGAIDERLMEELQGTADRDARYPMYGEGFVETGEGGPPNGAGVGNFLSEQEKEPEPEKTKPEPKVEVALVDPDVPTWKMQIFRGENLEEVNLELPVEEVPEEETAEEGGASGTSDENAPTERKSPFAPVLEKFKNLPFGK
ncbi:MAG: Flp pilus assembly protein CpaB [Planctomycetaceae bacterium]